MFGNQIITDLDLSLEDDMILDEIDNQINFAVPIYQSKKNFLQILHQKYNSLNASRMTADGDLDDYEQINDGVLENAYGLVVMKLRDILGVCLDMNTGSINYEIIDLIYNTFVINLHSNLIDYIITSICSNKQMFATSYVQDRIVNPTVKMARKQFKSKNDATIAIHLHEIVERIICDENLVNPETIIQVLFNSNPEDYEYNTCMNLYNLNWLSFDIDKFIKHIQNIYADPMNFENLKIAVMEQIIPTFPVKTGDEPEVEE